MSRAFLAALAFVVAGCAGPIGEMAERRQPPASSLPPMKVFASAPQRPTTRANSDILRDFLDLSFRMESGRPLPAMTRFEEPILVAVAAGAPPSLDPDLDRLLSRLRGEAGIDIRRARAGESVNVTIEAVPRRELQRYVPQAACFVVPRITGWRDFTSNRRSSRTDWSQLQRREEVSIFIPGDVSPQEIRDCLHEELAQAIGPLNDLYRLSDSVFNDDNFNTVLTGFDMLILRTYYAPELRNGMTEDEAARVLPAVLARLNPAGERAPAAPLGPTPPEWAEAIQTALGAGRSQSVRRRAGLRAVEIAADQNWYDGRAAFSLYALGRLSMTSDPGRAIAAFIDAARIYRALPGYEVQAAHVSLQLAALALSSGQADASIRLVDESLPAARESENAALLATLEMIKAEALDTLGRRDEARTVRLDSLGWARYGFGSDQQVRDRLLEVAALTPNELGN